MEFWIFINVLSHFIWKKIVDYLHFWHTMTLAVKYFTGKKGLSRKTATPGSAFDQIAVVVEYPDDIARLRHSDLHFWML